VESLAKQLEEELAGRDVGGVVRTVRKEINEKIKAAVKNPTRQTDTLRLLLKLIREPGIRLVGNDLLVEEMPRYA
jgi:hypothetical protein